MQQLMDVILKLFKKKKKLPGHLRAIKLRSLWNEFGQGQGIHIAVVDLPGDHSNGVIEILKRVAPRAQIHFYSALQDNYTRIPEALNTIKRDFQNGLMMDVINISMITGDTPDLAKIIHSLHQDHGIVIIAASGNDGLGPYYPAAYLDDVISVGSLYHKTGTVSPFTSKPFEVLAPGEDIEGLDGYGTSWAAPHITGIAACMLRKVHPMKIEHRIIHWLK